MNDIIERLRSGEDGLEYAAADEIERLRAECQRLAGEVSRAHKDALTWMERATAARREGIEAAAQWVEYLIAEDSTPHAQFPATIRALLEGGR